MMEPHIQPLGGIDIQDDGTRVPFRRIDRPILSNQCARQYAAARSDRRDYYLPGDGLFRVRRPGDAWQGRIRHPRRLRGSLA